ncbi:MAG: TlpA disulfide reductase family protein [Gammaproteobacteria bacterium]
MSNGIRNRLFVLLTLAITQYCNADSISEPSFERPGTRVAAPAFSLENLEGKHVHLEEFKDNVIMLNFWATWCVPCREEMPSMQALWRSYQDKGFIVVAIASDRGNRNGVNNFVMSLALDFPVLLDPTGNTRNTYEVTGLPMTYFIGKDGKFLGRVIGARDWQSDSSIELVESLLHF